jgi:hypothetical protein
MSDGGIIGLGGEVVGMHTELVDERDAKEFAVTVGPIGSACYALSSPALLNALLASQKSLVREITRVLVLLTTYTTVYCMCLLI